mmetsp:Transcript_7422/g.10617  ORF Transcript_7422/g.10617 Transcript_7422/m.10617 type:complete len:87 (+) Transcript_7422:138-398(+)
MVILPAILKNMNSLLDEGILESVDSLEESVVVKIVPPAKVGTFSEEERSRQVRVCHRIFVIHVELNLNIFQRINHTKLHYKLLSTM